MSSEPKWYLYGGLQADPGAHTYAMTSLFFGLACAAKAASNELRAANAYLAFFYQYQLPVTVPMQVCDYSLIKFEYYKLRFMKYVYRCSWT